jgi:YHS domain-containing protein
MKNLVLFLLLGALITGCTPTTEPAPEGDTNVTTDQPANDADKPATKPDEGASTGTEMSPAVYTNDKGQIVCPVMGAPTTEEDAVGFQDYEGVRYYFCCGDCPKAFEKDPTRWIKK